MGLSKRKYQEHFEYLRRLANEYDSFNCLPNWDEFELERLTQLEEAVTPLPPDLEEDNNDV